jgi:hypothetical protein
VFDGVRVVWGSLLEESLEVVYRRPCLALVAACSGHNMQHVGAAHFLVIATIVSGRSCDPLKALLAPLLAVPSTLLGVLVGDIR